MSEAPLLILLRSCPDEQLLNLRMLFRSDQVRLEQTLVQAHERLYNLTAWMHMIDNILYERGATRP